MKTRLALLTVLSLAALFGCGQTNPEITKLWSEYDEASKEYEKRVSALERQTANIEAFRRSSKEAGIDFEISIGDDGSPGNLMTFRSDARAADQKRKDILNRIIEIDPSGKDGNNARLLLRN